MKKLIQKHWREIGAFSAAVTTMTAVVAVIGYGLLFSTTQLDDIGQNEGGYWTVAQYQIQFERLDSQLDRYAAGTDKNINKLQVRQQALRAKFDALAKQAPPSDHLGRPVPVYRESVDKLRLFMNQVDVDLERIKTDSAVAFRMLGRFDEIRETVSDLSNAVRFAESNHRATIQSNVNVWRSKMLAFVVILWISLVICLGLFVYNFYRVKLLKSQNKALSLAEGKAGAALADAIDTRNTILGTISHELKTPLQTIISSVDLLFRRLGSDRDSDVVSRLLNAAERLQAQMEDLNDYARLGAGKLELRRIVFDPGEMLDRVVKEFKGQARNRGLDLVLRRKKRAVQIASDAHRLEQIATNLITNAIKYTPKGRIQVTLELLSKGGHKLHLIVEDTGPGISQEKVGHVFLPFTQLDQSLTRKYDGAGMGLAIVQRLVELFRGTIEVQSMLGRGTRFDVIIPVELVFGEVSGPENSRILDTEERRVLLVDDNAEVRVSFKDVLTAIGYVCDVAESGQVALQKMGTHSYDVVLLDINMPGMDGFEVAEVVRTGNGRNRNVPIIALSAYSPEHATPEQKAHFAAHIVKPVRMNMLRDKVEEVLKVEQRST